MNNFALNHDDEKTLLSIARKAIHQYLTDHSRIELTLNEYSPALQTECGAFVSLHINSELRGCIGRIKAKSPLVEIVRDMAISASFFDSRFSPLDQTDFEQVEIEISVLTPLRRVDSIKEIVPGKHGIFIRKGTRSGTFLPQVAERTNWTVEQFLGHCARDKAGIGWNGWKEAEIYTYEAIVFSEQG